MSDMGFCQKIVVNNKLISLLFHKWFGVSKLLKLAKVVGNERVLELGCGVGVTTGLIASKFEKSEITALDYDRSQIEIAKRKRIPGNIRFVDGDAANLRFENNSFDVVFEVLAFHHVLEYEKAINEAYRVLKRDGRFLVMDIALKSLGPLHKLIKFEPTHFTRGEFIAKLKGAGFIVRKCKGKLLFAIEAVKAG